MFSMMRAQVKHRDRAAIINIGALVTEVTVEDKKGKTGMTLAKEEGNKDVLRACEEWLAASSHSAEPDAKNSASDSGARQRRGAKGSEDKVVADDDDIHDVD